MPLPTPNKNEEQSAFIGRCSGILNEEFPDNKQRAAVCYSQWRKSKKGDSVDREFTFHLDKESNLKLDPSTGFLYGKARLTRTGVFDYYDVKGNLMREYRSDEEVFDKVSMDSLSLKPIVDDHPPEMVTSDNINSLQVGSVGEIINIDGQYLTSNIVITDKEMVETILDRKKMGLTTELSCGYSCMLVPEIGNHDSDGYYTFAQKNIKYNHVAIVDRGRAGDQVKILDGKNKKKEQKMAKVQFSRKAIKCDSLTLDQITQVVDEDNLNVINLLSDKLDEAVLIIENITQKKDEFQAKFDQATETINTLKTQVDSLNDINSPVISAMLKERSDVETIATKLGVDCKDKDVKTIKCDSILAMSKNADLKDKSDLYINTRFDAVKDIVNEQIKNDGNDKFSNFMNNLQNKEDKSKCNPRENFIKKDKEQNTK